jgi:Flp pilus assembly protein TadG
VEFALVVPILFAVMFGLIDTGRFIATRTFLAQAAAAGSRAMCLGGATSSSVDQAVRDSSPGVAITVDWSTTSTQCTDSTGTAKACTPPMNGGDVVNLRVQYNFVPAFFRTLQRTITNDSRVVCP